MDKMAQDWSYPKESHWIRTEVGTGQEILGGSKVRPSQETWKRTVEEEAVEVRKIRSEVKRIAVAAGFNY
jgi:hypothetical protein